MAKSKQRKNSSNRPDWRTENVTPISPDALHDPSFDELDCPSESTPVIAGSTSCSAATEPGSIGINEIKEQMSIRRAQQRQSNALPDPLIDKHPLWKTCRKVFLTGFICWNLAAVSISLCAPSKFQEQMCKLFNPYLWYVGLWQDFCVFVPDPKDYNIHMSADVVLKDGRKIQYRFPNPAESKDELQRMRLERWRKWADDNVNSAEYKVWFPDTCKWIARQYNSDPKNPPIQVTLERQFTAIRLPGAGTVDGPMESKKFYTYDLKPGDLQ